MKKLLIVEHVTVMAEALVENLRDEYDIVICEEARRAVDMLADEQPDAMIIDLGLPHMDGLTVLSDAFPDLPPFIVALSSVVTSAVRGRAAALGIDYLFEIPADMKEIRAVLKEASMRKIPARRTMQHLRELGFRPGLDGYICIVAAIPHILEDPARKLGLEVYDHVSKVCGLTDYRDVERAIRFSINDAWGRRIVENWARYFPLNRNGDIDRPKNKDLIRVLMMLVK